MAGVGFDRRTGAVIVGWDHARQSLEVCVTTELGDLVQQRDFGSPVPSLVDRPQTVDTIMDLYMAIAEAVEPVVSNGVTLGEPRFVLSQLAFSPGIDGATEFVGVGVYYPRGHLGDFSVSEDVQGVLLRT